MAIDSIQFIPEGADVSELAGLKPLAPSSPFLTWLEREMDTVNQRIQSAEIQVRQLAAGEQDNLHQVMISLERAKLAFELTLQVRNKLLEGYQEIMRMQV